MSRAVEAWNRFWFREVDGAPLGWVRIGVAAAGLTLWLETLPLIPRYYSDSGEFPIEAARAWTGDYLPRALLSADVLGGTGAAYAVFALQLVALLLLLVGFRTRLAAWASWLLLVWVQARNPTFLNGGDDVLRLASLYLAVGYLAVPARDRALSLDRRLALGSRSREGGGPEEAELGANVEVSGSAPLSGDAPPPTAVPAWTLRLFQVQLVIIYAVSGGWKLLGSAWWNGDAVYYAMDNATFSRVGAPEGSWFRPMSMLATWIVVAWEVLFAPMVAWRPTRKVALAVGVAVHVLILVLLNVGVFSLAMLALYPAFVDGRTLRRWQARLSPWGSTQPSWRKAAASSPRA